MNKKLLSIIVLLIVITSAVSFAAAAVVFYGWSSLIPKYEISFDAKNISLENIKKFNDVKNILSDRYYENVDENALIEGAISGMAYSLKDPYTVYFTKEQMKVFTEKSEGSYVGIGVSITMDNEGLLTILEPFEDSPALKAGIKKGDKIIKVDGQDVTGLRDENLVISMIKGEENTKVKITVYRPSEDKSVELDITRKRIRIYNLKSEVLPGDIGYIKIIMFDSDIAKDFEEHLKKLLAKKIKGLVIDVRDNPGGDYHQVVQIADRLLPKGLIVSTRYKNNDKDEEYSDNKELGLPLAILVNGNSASASEILSGAVKDHNKGKLIGSKTFGKGLVQTVIPFKDGSGLKVTIARYYTPSGVCIQGIGIQPDEEVLLDEKYKDVPVSQVPRKEDTQLARAVEIVKAETK